MQQYHLFNEGRCLKPGNASYREYLLEDTDGLRCPPAATSRCGSLPPSASADVRSSDDAIVFKGLGLAIRLSRFPRPVVMGSTGHGQLLWRWVDDAREHGASATEAGSPMSS